VQKYDIVFLTFCLCFFHFQFFYNASYFVRNKYLVSQKVLLSVEKCRISKKEFPKYQWTFSTLLQISCFYDFIVQFRCYIDMSRFTFIHHLGCCVDPKCPIFFRKSVAIWDKFCTRIRAANSSWKNHKW
jgi:hypothetical protein